MGAQIGAGGENQGLGPGPASVSRDLGHEPRHILHGGVQKQNFATSETVELIFPLFQQVDFIRRNPLFGQTLAAKE